MRLRVLAAAAALGYLPPARMAAADPRCRTVAVILGRHVGSALPGSLQADMLAGVAEAAGSHGLVVQVAKLGTADEARMEAGGLPLALEGVRLRGALLLGVREWAAARTLARQLPCVLVSNDMHQGEPWVSLNICQYSATVRMLDHLLGLGHRRIGFIRSIEAEDRGAERMGAFVAGLAMRGLPLRTSDLLTLRLTSDWRPAVSASRRGVSAWIADSQASGERLVAALNEAGLPVPERISVAGFRGAARTRPPQLTGVFGPGRAMGRAAVQALLWPLQQAEPGRRLLVDAAMDAGATTAVVAAGPGRAARRSVVSA